MANYSKLTDFASKDTLPSGTPAKIIKGTELDDEFLAIKSAIEDKAEESNAALTGTPTAPTATAGTNTTQIATTAFVTTAVDNAAGANTITATKLAVADNGTAGQFLVSDGDGTFSWETLEVVQPTIQVFTTTGTWTKPTGCTKVKVTVTGGGANCVNKLEGGGAGGTAIKYIDVTGVSSVAVTVGATQASSSFGTYCTGNGTSSTSGGGASGGDINIAGANGGAGFYNTAAAVTVGGDGGASFWGGGGAGGASASSSIYGAGAGGCYNSSGSHSGAQGVVVVECFY